VQERLLLLIGDRWAKISVLPVIGLNTVKP
jgi:hypothetical protein